MSRLQGRVEDIYSFDKYIIENYNKPYVPDNTLITMEELEKSFETLFPYLYKEYVTYINNCNVAFYWNGRLKQPVYSDQFQKDNVFFFPTKQLVEEYKADFMFYIGDLLSRKRLDYIHDVTDTKHQYGDLLPLLTQYLFYKETGREERFTERNISELRYSAPKFIKAYEKNQSFHTASRENKLLFNAYHAVVPLSSLDASLQLIDQIGDNKDEMRYLLHELIFNEHSSREEVMKDRKIETFGFKRLRKEIELKKQGAKNE